MLLVVGMSLKNQEFSWFSFMQVACDILLQSSRRSYNFASNLISIGGLHTKLWAPKVAQVLTVGILKLPLGSPETKWQMGVGLVARHIVYYKGEGGGFPQVRVVVNLMSSCLLMARPCTKVLQLHPNQLVVWFSQIRVSDWITCQSS